MPSQSQPEIRTGKLNSVKEEISHRTPDVRTTNGLAQRRALAESWSKVKEYNSSGRQSQQLKTHHSDMSSQN